jgi:UDP-N-acetylglucosamine--N-acetylmuramyl-(pentapeptide) pyrophosphoryl-undecaprenol N-acetylglucosamine transferase
MVLDLDFTDALVMTGGGTGGHFFPALALAEGARGRWNDLPICFVGAKRGIEGRRLPGGPWPHLLLDVEGIVGRSLLATLRALWKLTSGRSALLRLWRHQRPRAVIGTGGYGAGPALLAARHLSIPYFLHESNAAPGALVRRLAGRAQRVWCGMPEVAPLLPGADCLAVGTPVRAAFLREFLPLARLEPPHRLLVLGGSGGAAALNDALAALAPALLEAFPDWEIHHQTGLADYERLGAQRAHPRHLLYPFLEDMDGWLEGASLVISRSGASTCAELAACGRPAILVPFPRAAADHQRVNAQALAHQGRAVLVPQGPTLAQDLAREAARLMESRGARLALARPEPNQAVLHCLEDLARTLAPG